MQMGTNHISVEHTFSLFIPKKLNTSYCQNKVSVSREVTKNTLFNCQRNVRRLEKIVCKFSVIQQDAKEESELNFEVSRLPAGLLECF